MKSKKFLINLLEKSNFSEILEYRNAVSQFRQSPLDQIEEYEKRFWNPEEHSDEEVQNAGRINIYGM